MSNLHYIGRKKEKEKNLVIWLGTSIIMTSFNTTTGCILFAGPL